MPLPATMLGMNRAKAFDLTLAGVRVALGFFAILGGLAVGGWVATQVGLALGLAAAGVYALCVWQVFRGLYLD